MATGEIDANGIYKYGEDDQEPTISQLLNKLADSTSDTVTRLENMNGLTAAQKATARDNLGIGLVALKPLNIEKIDGTAELLDSGKVIFKNVSAISLNQIFTLDYEFFDIAITEFTGTAMTDVSALVQLRANGGTHASNYYQNGINTYGTNIASYGVGMGAAGWDVGVPTVNNLSAIMLKIVRPRQAGQTILHAKMQGWRASTFAMFNISGLCTASLQADGLTLQPSAAGQSFSGNIEVFGYNR